MPYSQSHRALLSETRTNRIIIENSFKGVFIVGQGIGIGHNLGDGCVLPHGTITHIKESVQGIEIYFDKTVDVTKGAILYSSVWKNGATDSINATSGTVFSQFNGNSPIVWRGIENPYGHTWEWIDGVNILDRQAYVCDDPNCYDDLQTERPYQKTCYLNAGSDESYIKSFGCDPAHPFATFPVLCDGTPDTYYGCCYWYRMGLRGVIFGGSWYNADKAGIFCTSGWSDYSFVHVNTSARLLYRP